MTRTTCAALFIVGAGLLTACKGASSGPGSGAGPLATHLLASPVRFDGRVEERLDAGPYAYLRVAREGAADAWVVALRPQPRAGDRVHVAAVGHAERFDSARLGRRFDELWFAAVRRLD